jgi:hypothetical protein
MANEISSEVIVSRELRALHDRLVEAKEKLRKWHMTFEVKVQPSFIDQPLFEVLVQARVGEKIFSKLLPPSEIEYFAEDKATLTQYLARMFIEALLSEVAADQLGQQLAPAIENANKLNASRNKQ